MRYFSRSAGKIVEGEPPVSASGVSGYLDQGGDASYIPEVTQPTVTPSVQPSVQTSPEIDPEEIVRNTPAPKDEKSLLGFAGNVLKSGGKTALDIIKAGVNLFNPNMEKNTVANLGKLAVGTAQLAIPGEQGLEDRPRAVGEFYKERYGSLPKITKTLYEDPVGAALDASVVLGGAGAVVKGVGTAGKISSLTRAGEALSTASKVVDPLQAVGKLAGMGTSKIAGKAGEISGDLSKDTILSATKASAGSQAKFSELIGTKLEDFVKENGLQGRGPEVVAKTQSKIKVLQDEYNSMVRSGEYIDATGYINGLRKRAEDIRAANLSPEAESIASKLDEYAKLAESKVIGQGNIKKTIPVDVLTNTKSSQFGSVPGSAMADPTSYHAGKIAGGVALQELDKLYPGSAEIGQKLQALREFEDIATKAQFAGKGNQLVNLLKSNQSGPVLGYVAGSVFGNPLVGTSIGLLVGIGLNNPKVLAVLSKMFEKGSKYIPKIESKTASVISGTEEAGKYATRALPSIVPSESTDQQEQNYQKDIQNKLPPITDNISQTTEKSTRTGYTLDQLSQASTKARMEGKDKIADQIDKIYSQEKEYQDSISKTTKDSSQVSDLKASADMMETLDSVIDDYSDVIGPITGRARKLNPYDTKAQDFQSQMMAVAQVVGRAMEGGVLRAEDMPKYRAILPQITDTPEVAKAKIANVKKLLRQQIESRKNQTETSTLPAITDTSQTNFNEGAVPKTAQVSSMSLPKITQAFGVKNPKVERFSKGGINRGVDLAAKTGTPLYVPDGQWKVTETYSRAKGKGYIGNRTNTGYGNSVVIKNTKTGEIMRLSHLSTVNVKSGQLLAGGSLIGKSGATGNVTGSHLDLEYKTPKGKLADASKTKYVSSIFRRAGG